MGQTTHHNDAGPGIRHGTPDPSSPIKPGEAVRFYYVKADSTKPVPLRPRGPLLGVLLAPAEGWVVPILERDRVRALLLVGIPIIAGSPNQAAGRLLLARSGRGCVSYHTILIKPERPAVAATRRMQHDRRLREEARARGGGGSRARATRERRA